jgi:ATP-dependent DNA helicase PIF1
MIIEPTKLFPIRSKVDIINKFKMSKLKGEEREYELKQLIDNVITKSETKSETIFSTKEIEMEMTFLSNSLICDKLLKIKIGAQVMCIINISSTIDDSILLSNGSQGIVIGFCEVTGCPRVRFNNGVERVMNYYTWVSNKIPYISVSQVPLILAWALTIHKSQGATLDAAEIDVGNDIFECGQTYVALSRVKSLNGLYLSSYDPTKIRIYKKVKDYYLGLL